MDFDELDVVNLFNKNKSSLVEIETLIEDINFVGNFVNIVHFCHILREDNKFVHAIAILASSHGCSLIWSILSLIHDEVARVIGLGLLLSIPFLPISKCG